MQDALRFILTWSVRREKRIGQVNTVSATVRMVWRPLPLRNAATSISMTIFAGGLCQWIWSVDLQVSAALPRVLRLLCHWLAVGGQQEVFAVSDVLTDTLLSGGSS